MRRTQTGQDLPLVVGLSLALALAVHLDSSQSLRIPLGFVCACSLPGYTVVAALFPRNDDLTGSERGILSLGFSVATVSLIGLLLNYTPWGISLESALVSVTLLILFLSGVAYYRRSQLSPENRFMIRLKFDVSGRRQMGLVDRLLSAVLALSIVAAVVALVYAVARPKTGERFTEFYLLGTDGIASGYPTEIVAGEPIALILGIANREHAEAQYRIERAVGDATELVAEAHLAHNETWEQPSTFTLTEPGENHKIQFLLYRKGDTEPHRSLHLWITVRAVESNQR